MKRKIIIGFLSTSLFLSGCGNVEQQGIRSNEGTPERQMGILQEQTAPARTNDQNLSIVVDGQNIGSIGVIRQADQLYIPLDTFFRTVGYTEIKLEKDLIQIGFTDPIYTITKDSTRAVVDEQPIDLPHAVTTIDNQTYATIPSLQTLLESDYNVQIRSNSLILTPIGTVFPEDDNWDNFKGDHEVAPTVTRADANQIISRAKRYLGVKYVFGATTGRTNAFDCSSFTQYLYGKEGIRLPRTARSQAARGTYVRVSNLKPGDLLFFSVPGRFTNDRTVGHVGIYMGNGRMIHAAPPKVQITNVAQSRYWKRVYLGAKRVG